MRHRRRGYRRRVKVQKRRNRRYNRYRMARGGVRV